MFLGPFSVVLMLRHRCASELRAAIDTETEMSVKMRNEGTLLRNAWKWQTAVRQRNILWMSSCVVKKNSFITQYVETALPDVGVNRMRRCHRSREGLMTVAAEDPPQHTSPQLTSKTERPDCSSVERWSQNPPHGKRKLWRIGHVRLPEGQGHFYLL